MSTLNVETGTTPVNIVSSLSLSAGKTYLVQAMSAGPVYLYEQPSSNSAPDPSTVKPFLLRPLDTWSITVKTGQDIYAFTAVDTNTLVLGLLED